MKVRFRSTLRLIVLSLLFAPIVAYAQGDVRITLLRPPPNQLRVADLWRADLVNNTDQAFTVRLHGWATEAKDGEIVDATSRDFDVAPRQRMRLTGTQLEPIKVNRWNSRYRDVVTRTGLLPTGEYTVCVEVLMVSNDSILGTDCYDQPVELEQLSPPILINPPDESGVSDRLPVFSWLPPTPLRRGDVVNYEIKVVEMLGRQTAYDALKSNPAFFTKRAIAENSVRYPLGARGFTVGRRYAWQIKAFLVQRFGDQIAVGESEVWWFQYQQQEFIGDQDTLVGRTPVRRPGTDIQKPGTTASDVTDIKSMLTVQKDETLLPGVVPPGINLQRDLVPSVIDKDLVKISPMLLRAMMHSCQGSD